MIWLFVGPLQSKLLKRSAKITINEEATLRVKKIQNAIEYEKNLYELQVLIIAVKIICILCNIYYYSNKIHKHSSIRWVVSVLGLK